MVSYNIASLTLVLLITIATVDYTSAASVNCTALNETSCCGTHECFFLHCTDLKNNTLVHQECHIKANESSVVKAFCKPDTNTDLCEGPAPASNCSALGNNQTACCDAGCIYSTDCKSTKGKSVSGCYNETKVGGMCTESYTNLCVPHPAMTCSNFTEQKECCNQTTLGCVYVNCTGTDKKAYNGCFKKDDAKCSPLEDMCKPTPITTTSKPTAKPAPVWEECEQYNSTLCCTNELYKCISVNCTTAQITGCYSAFNLTVIKNRCKEEYRDECVAPKPSSTIPPSTTTAYSSTTAGNTGKHFDGASFLGGIVLCAGIIVIIFFAVKFYKSRRASNNYHQM